MSDPRVRHASALAAIDRMIDVARDIDQHTHPDWAPATQARVRELAGCRRILERHQPVLCRHCPESRQHYVCAAHPMLTWQDCPDWVDASAGLPETRTEEEPHGR